MMKVSENFLKELYSDEGVRVIFMSNQLDLEPFFDSIVRALLAVNIGSHKSTVNTLLKFYGFKNAEVIIEKAEEKCQETYTKKLINHKYDTTLLDPLEIRRLYQHHFGSTQYHRIIEDSYAQSYRDFFGLRPLEINKEGFCERKISRFEPIDNKDKLQNIFLAASMIMAKELKHLEKHIKHCATHATSAPPELSQFSHENYLASFPFTVEEAMILLNNTIKDSESTTENLTITEKKIRKFLKNNFREIFARYAAQERGYEVKTPKQWAKEEGASYEADIMVRGFYLRYDNLIKNNTFEHKENSENKKLQSDFAMAMDVVMSQFYFSKIHTANACSFEINDGIAFKSANWAFLNSSGYSHNLNVLATTSHLNSALSFTNQKIGFTVMQYYAVTESIFTGSCTRDGISPEDEYALFYEKPYELLASVIHYDNDNSHAIINPRFITMSTEEIWKKLNIKENSEYKKTLEIALRKAQESIGIKFDSIVENFSSMENKKLKINYPKGYETYRSEQVYQPRLKWSNQHITSMDDIKNRQLNYFELSCLEHCSFRNIIFRSNMSFYKASMSDVCFIGCDFTDVSWIGADLRNVRFINCKLSVKDLLDQAHHVDEKTRTSLSVLTADSNLSEYQDSKEYKSANTIKRAYKFFSHLQREEDKKDVSELKKDSIHIKKL